MRELSSGIIKHQTDRLFGGYYGDTFWRCPLDFEIEYDPTSTNKYTDIPEIYKPITNYEYGKDVLVTGSSRFGPRVIFGEAGFHNGIDIGRDCALKSTYYSTMIQDAKYPDKEDGRAFIVASRPGKVIAVADGTNRIDNGCYVKIDHGDGYKTTYYHLVVNSALVRVGDEVDQYTLLGRVGNTGRSTGPHLHFGISLNDKWVDPADYIFGGEYTPLKEKEDVEETFSPIDFDKLLSNNLYGSNSSFLKSFQAIQSTYRKDIIGDSNFEPSVLLQNKKYPSLPTVKPPTVFSPYWKKPINPYMEKGQGGFCLPSNNAYSWGRMYEIIASRPSKKVYTHNLCRDKDSNWFEYNKAQNIYQFGSLPRIGAVACWLNLDYNKSISSSEKTYTAIVEAVNGSDSIVTSEYSSSDSYGKFVTKTRQNFENNWDMDKSKFKFLGFIYPLSINDLYSNIDYNNDNLVIDCSSNSIEASSITFPLPDFKHYNKLRIVYDMEFKLPFNPLMYALSEKLMPIDAFLDSFDVAIVLSQLVSNDGKSFSKLIGTEFPLKTSGSQGFVFGDFPTGSFVVSGNFIKDTLKKSKYDIFNSMHKSDVIENTFDISTIKIGLATHNIFDDMLLYKLFRRKIPTYMTIVVKSKKVDNTSSFIKLNIHNLELQK